MNFMDFIKLATYWLWQLISRKLIENFYDLWFQNVRKFSVFVFPSLWTCPLSKFWAWVLAPNLSLPVLAPNLCLPAKTPNLYLQSLTFNLFLSALTPNFYLRVLTETLNLPALVPK